MQSSHSPGIRQSDRCGHSETSCAYALLLSLPTRRSSDLAHIASCPDCRRELESLRPVVDRLDRKSVVEGRRVTSLEGRLARSIAEETGKEPVLATARPGKQAWAEPEWDDVAPGIECQLLA